MKKILALLLVLTVTVQIIPANDLFAASKKTRYVKEFKLFAKAGASQSDAESWCDKLNSENKKKGEDTDWQVVPGNLNDGADATFKKAQGVYLCYQTTDNSEDAVTDIAVMNEKGNYSEGAYEILLKEQEKAYADLVDDMQDMLKEYRTNYKNKVYTAVQAHDYMNGFVEDDSKKLLGDFLLDATNDELTKVFLQANGKIVLMVQEQLSLAADTGKSTWLDRMEKLGSFNELRKKALASYGGNAAKADKALQTKYKDDAVRLLASWEDIGTTIKQIQNIAKKYGLDKMTEEEIVDWKEAQIKKDEMEADVTIYLCESDTITMLSSYEYDGKSLLDYFLQDYKDVSGDNIKYLYPLVASLTDAQKAGLDQSISIMKLVQDAISATALNDNLTSSSKAKEINKLGADGQETIDAVKEEMEKEIDGFTEKKISVYEGVDREIFEGGVAVTSVAENYSNGSETKWADAFVDSGKFKLTTITVGAGAVTFAIASAVCAGLVKSITKSIIKSTYEANYDMYKMAGITATEDLSDLSQISIMTKNYDEFSQLATGTARQVKKYNMVSNEMLKKGIEEGKGAALSIVKGLKIGFAVFAILLSIADIVLTVITLVEYYNRDHLPIPKFLVDVSVSEDKETSYSQYKTVYTQNGKEGDLNNGEGKQWLALYQSRDDIAGDPIIAPSKNDKCIMVKTGKSNKNAPTGYYPLHMFGTPNAAQNLTFADGESGFSYNDKKNGTYLYFKRDEDVVPSAIGSTMTGGTLALIIGLTLLGGVCVGMGGMSIYKRKKYKGK